jgi:hypothetical protein
MSDQEVILRALARVRGRLRLGYAVHDVAVVLGIVAVALLLWRALRLAGDSAPAVTACAILIALLLWIGGLFLLLRGLLVQRTTLARAAAEADRRAALDDELKTAYWFIEHRAASPWIAAQVERAARSAGALDVSRLLPLRVEPATLAASALTSVLLVALWFAPPLSPSSQALTPPASALSAAEAKQVQLLRDLAAQLQNDPEAAAPVEHALRELQRKDATAEEKQRALATARETLEQRNLNAASTREGLYQMAQKLRGNEALREVAAALEEGDARRAARALQAADLQGRTAAPAAGAAADQSQQKDLQRLLDQAANRDGKAEAGEASSAAAREAIDRLNQIAEQLDTQQQLNQASQALHQLQLAVAQRSTMSAGRFSQQAAQNATPSPNTGQTSMPGGIMFRSAAVALEHKNSVQQEGSKTGAAMGDSQADAPLGSRVAPLGVQLKKESVPNSAPEDAQNAAKNWFYAESKEQQSILELRDVRARESFAQAQSGAAEGISVRHRQIVKDYFMHLREAKP